MGKRPTAIDLIATPNAGALAGGILSFAKHKSLISPDASSSGFAATGTGDGESRRSKAFAGSGRREDGEGRSACSRSRRCCARGWRDRRAGPGRSRTGRRGGVAGRFWRARRGSAARLATGPRAGLRRRLRRCRGDIGASRARLCHRRSRPSMKGRRGRGRDPEPTMDRPDVQIDRRGSERRVPPWPGIRRRRPPTASARVAGRLVATARPSRAASWQSSASSGEGEPGVDDRQLEESAICACRARRRRQCRSRRRRARAGRAPRRRRSSARSRSVAARGSRAGGRVRQSGIAADDQPLAGNAGDAIARCRARRTATSADSRRRRGSGAPAAAP